MRTRRTLLLGAGTAAAAAGLAVITGPSHDTAAAEDWAPMPPGDSRYLIHYATRAANSHNTQPWLFVPGPDSVTIRPDFARATPVVDPDLHHLWASLGCAAENLVLAARAEGRVAEVETVAPDGIRIALGQASRARDPLFDAILARQCSRAEYDGRPVPPADLALLEQAARVPRCGVTLITDRARIDSFRDLIVDANTAQVQDPAFAAELATWIRFSTRQAVETRDGLYAAASGNPTLPAWLGRRVFSLVFRTGPENAKVVAQVDSSPGLAIFVAEQNDPAHWVAAGRSYQRFALQATRLGLKHAFLNQPTEVVGIRSQVAALLGIGGLRPNLLVRFGYGPEMPRSLRRPVEDVIVAN